MKHVCLFVGALALGLQPGCGLSAFQQAVLNFIGPTTIVASAGPNGVVNSGQAIVLDASESVLVMGSGELVSGFDAGFTYLWEAIEIPDGAVAPTLQNTNSTQCTFTGTTAGTYVIQVTVEDGIRTGTATATIEVL